MLEAGMRWRIENGGIVRVKLDRWIPRPVSFGTISPLQDLEDNTLVSSFIDNHNKC